MHRWLPSPNIVRRGERSTLLSSFLREMGHATHSGKQISDLTIGVPKVLAKVFRNQLWLPPLYGW
jgi:hypothetical protein